MNNDEWIELLNAINVHELLEESPSQKKPYLGLLLKKKETSTSRVFKDSIKPSQIDKPSKVVWSVTRSEYDSRAVQPKKPHQYLPMKTETEASKVLRIQLTPKSIHGQTTNILLGIIICSKSGMVYTFNSFLTPTRFCI